MPLTPLERMQHEASCRPAGEQQEQEQGAETDGDVCVSIKEMKNLRLTWNVLWFSEGEARPSSSSVSSLTRVYHCDVCDKDLSLTSTEILKHKRQHMYSAA